MADQGSTAGSDDTTALETTEWSANGKHAEAPTAVADRSEDAATADASEASADAAADADVDAVAASSPEDMTVAPSDDGAAFLTELVRAMQTTASAEKTRLTEDTDRRREAHLASVEARREAEATTMRSLANDDLKAIDVWADEERQRIQAERDRRATDVQTDLQTSLAAHGEKIDQEIEAVEAAIAGYRTQVDAFFVSLDNETDPVAIARHASARPAFPALEAIDVAPAHASADALEAAETDAVAEAIAVDTEAPDETETADDTVTAEATEAIEATSADAETTDEAAEADESPAPVAVMEPRGPSKLAESWAAWSGISAAPASAGSDVLAAVDVPADEATPNSSSEPVQLEPAAVVSGKGGRVLQSVPTSRPMSWLRRDHADGDRQNGDH